MKKVFSYMATAIVPVFLAWILGYARVPDTVDLIDYSSSGAELINSTETIASSLKIEANGKSVQKLSIYNLRFANKSEKNLQKVQVEFKVNGEKCELIASTIKGPQNYSESLIKKLSESKASATYLLEFINVSKKDSGEYFTASFLFSGEPPTSIEPIVLSPSIGFVDAKENSKAGFIAITIFIVVMAAYAYLIWWLDSYNTKRQALKQEKYERELSNFFCQKFFLSVEDANECTKEVSQLRVSVFKSEGKIRIFLRKFLT